MGFYDSFQQMKRKEKEEAKKEVKQFNIECVY